MKWQGSSRIPVAEKQKSHAQAFKELIYCISDIPWYILLIPFWMWWWYFDLRRCIIPKLMRHRHWPSLVFQLFKAYTQWDAWAWASNNSFRMFLEDPFFSQVQKGSAVQYSCLLLLSSLSSQSQSFWSLILIFLLSAVSPNLMVLAQFWCLCLILFMNFPSSEQNLECPWQNKICLILQLWWCLICTAWRFKMIGKPYFMSPSQSQTPWGRWSCKLLYIVTQMCILWMWPSNSDHQDCYISSRESQTKPSFTTVTWRWPHPMYILWLFSNVHIDHVVKKLSKNFLFCPWDRSSRSPQRHRSTGDYIGAVYIQQLTTTEVMGPGLMSLLFFKSWESNGFG